MFIFTILLKGKKISLSQNPQRKEEGTGSKLQGKKLRCQRTWGNRKDQGLRTEEERKLRVTSYKLQVKG